MYFGSLGISEVEHTAAGTHACSLCWCRSLTCTPCMKPRMETFGTGAVELRARVNNFDALRLFAALLVIWGHEYAVLGLHVPLIAHNEPGALGVVIFFAISGYLVSQSWLNDPHILRFALRRVLRIWPGMSVVVLLCAFVLGPSITTLPTWTDYLRHPQTWEYLSNLWLDTRYVLPGIFETNPLAASVNGPLWTIPLEVRCYVVLALIAAAGALRSRWWPPLGLLLLMAILQWRYGAPSGQTPPPWSFGLQYGMVFALGSTLAVWAPWWRPRWWTGLGLFLGFCVALHYLGPDPLAGQSVILGLGGAAVFVGQASLPVLRRAGRWGDFSYGLYIYAFPVQQSMVLWGATRWGFERSLLASLTVSLVLAGMSWHLIEKRALKLKPRRPSSQRPPSNV